MRRRLLLVTITVVAVLVLSGVQASGSNGSGEESDRVEQSSWGSIKLLFRGAGFSSDGASRSGGMGNHVRYTIRDSPEHALEKLVEAYTLMDADAFIDCLSDTFTFWLNEQDVIDDPTLPWYWDVSTETSIHWNMFGDSSVESIQLTLTQYGDPIELSPGVLGRSSDWVYRENYDLRVYMSGSFQFWANAGAVFRLAVDPNETGPSGEELWEVSRWSDVDSFDTPVEHTSWGRLKALFR